VTAVIALALLLMLAPGCGGKTSGRTNGEASRTGTLGLYLTDVPMDAANIEGVFITIDEIQFGAERGLGTAPAGRWQRR